MNYRNFSILTLIGFFLFSLNFKAQADGIEFFTGSWDEVVAKAKKANKMIFIDAYATWCGPCKMMDKNVFVQKEAGDFYNTNFVPYKMDVDAEEGGEIFARYGGEAMPTYLFVNADEELVFKKVGYMELPDFLQVGKSALEIPKLQKQYKDGDRSPEFVKEYITAMAGTGDEGAKELAEKYFDELSEEELMENIGLMSEYPVSADSRGFKFMMENLEKVNEEYGLHVVFGMVEPVWDDLFSKATENKDKKYVDEMVSILEKIGPFLPDPSKVEEVKGRMYEAFENAISEEEEPATEEGE